MADHGEAPMSVSTVIYYKGFSTTITRRNLEALITPLIDKQLDEIDRLIEERDVKPSWNPETNKVALDKDADWVKEATPVVQPQLNGGAQSLGNCSRCGAPNKLSKQGKPYCSKVCWKA